jgi:hypothetical protein
MGNDAIDGSIEEAAAAIQALLDGKSGQPEPEVAQPDTAPVADPEPVEAEAAVEGEDLTPVEEAAPAELPDDTSPEEVTPPAIIEEPKPAPVAAPKAAESTGKDPLTATTEYLTQLNAIVPQLQARLAASFPEIKTYDDLEKLAMEDHARYFQFDLQNKRLQEAVAAQTAASSQYRALWTQQEDVKLKAQLPEWSDPVKGPALKQSLTAFAKEVGYTDTQINQAGAADIILLRDAMLFRDGKRQEQAKAVAHAKALKTAQEKAKAAPPVQKPGVARTADTASEKIKELEARFDRTGHPDDLGALLVARGM